MKKNLTNITGSAFAIIAIGSTAALFAQQSASPPNSGDVEKKAVNVTRAVSPAQTAPTGYSAGPYNQNGQYFVTPPAYPSYPGTITPLSVAPGNYNGSFPAQPPSVTAYTTPYDTTLATLLYEEPETGKLLHADPSTMDEAKTKLVVAYAGKLNEAQKTFVSKSASASEKADAKEIIAADLRSRFDADLEQRRTKIKELEDQIKQLREQVDRRENNKEKLVQLRLQLIENESEGLGFPVGWNNHTRPANVYRSTNVSNGLSTTRDWIAPTPTNDSGNRYSASPAVQPNSGTILPTISTTPQTTPPASGPTSR